MAGLSHHVSQKDVQLLCMVFSYNLLSRGGGQENQYENPLSNTVELEEQITNLLLK